MASIVFKMKMEPDTMSYPLVTNKTHAVYAAEVAAQRVSWLPTLLGANYELDDNNQFTLTDDAAIHMRDLVNSGKVPFVEIVSSS